MYTFKNMKFEIKKDYDKTSDPHLFALGNPKKCTFYLCKEVCEKDNDYYRGVTRVITDENTGESIECIPICKAETMEEIDTVISLYLKTIEAIEHSA